MGQVDQREALGKKAGRELVGPFCRCSSGFWWWRVARVTEESNLDLLLLAPADVDQVLMTGAI